MKWLNFALLTIGSIVLAGCIGGVGGPGRWEVSYSDNARHVASSGIYIASINVVVPTSLTVSEENTLAPDADIVWRGEAIGNRHAQVRQIILESAQFATQGLNGPRTAQLNIQVHTFHALSDYARARAPEGVHNIGFFAEIVDARTGEIIVPRENISADLQALTGENAVHADIIGQGQRYRIVNHLTQVFRGWLGLSATNRGGFNQRGR